MESFQQQPLCWILPVKARHQLRLHPGLQLLQRQLLAGGDFYKLFLVKAYVLFQGQQRSNQSSEEMSHGGLLLGDLVKQQEYRGSG